MAKSSRASTKKLNRGRLRHKVFGPVEDARTTRLATKLMEVAQNASHKVEASSITQVETEPEAQEISKASSQGMVVDQVEGDKAKLQANERRDRRERRKTLKKHRSSTTFKVAKPFRKSSATFSSRRRS